MFRGHAVTLSVFATVLCLLIGCAGSQTSDTGTKPDNSSSAGKEPAPTGELGSEGNPYTLSLEEWKKTFAEDKNAATTKYKNQTARVSGVIQKITPGGNIHLSTESAPEVLVVVDFADSEKDKLASRQLKVGDKITAKGRVKGLTVTGGHVWVSNCELQ